MEAKCTYLAIVHQFHLPIPSPVGEVTYHLKFILLAVVFAINSSTGTGSCSFTSGGDRSRRIFVAGSIISTRSLSWRLRRASPNAGCCCGTRNVGSFVGMVRVLGGGCSRSWYRFSGPMDSNFVTRNYNNEVVRISSINNSYWAYVHLRERMGGK